MRLKNVNRVKRDIILVLPGKPIQAVRLPPKWRSGIASEDEHDGFEVHSDASWSGFFVSRVLTVIQYTGFTWPWPRWISDLMKRAQLLLKDADTGQNLLAPMRPFVFS
jgi:hypothetical protein